MIKHTQINSNCLSVFDHFVGIVLKGLKISEKRKSILSIYCTRSIIRISKVKQKKVFNEDRLFGNPGNIFFVLDKKKIGKLITQP